MRVGFVLTETVDGRFTPWESFLDWESYIDLYCLALTNRGHVCIKYVPSTTVRKTVTYRHRFGHAVKRVPVSHSLLNPAWIARPRTGSLGFSTTAYQLQGLGFTINLLREVVGDRIDILHYSSYYSSLFVPAALMGAAVPLVAQYSGGALPDQPISRLAWRTVLAPSLRAASAILIGDYRSELESLRHQAGARHSKIRKFDAPVVDTTEFSPRPHEEALSEVGFESDSVNILSVTFIPKKHDLFLAKDPFLLVSLFAEASRLSKRKLTLHIGGFGPGMSELSDHIDNLGLGKNVMLLGKVEHRSLPVYYSACDLVFVPYPFEKLNEGSVTYEAFACGKPVAGWKRAETTPVEQKGGFLVDRSPSSGAKQLVARLEDFQYLAAKGAEGSSEAKGVSCEVAAMKLEAAYSEAISVRQ